MSDTTSNASGSEASGTGQAGTDQGSGAPPEGQRPDPAQGAGDTTHDEAHDPERARATLDNLRRREKELESELGRLRAEKAERDRAGMSEAEQVQAQLTDAQRERDEVRQERDRLVLERDVANVARTLGFRDPDLAAALVRPSDVMADGKVDEVAVTAKLKAELKSKPYLGTAGGADAGAGGKGAPARGINEMIRSRARS